MNVDHWRRGAPWLLAVSATGSLATSSFTYAGDLHVYVFGGEALKAPSVMYTPGWIDQMTALPFVYPPFAAMLFYPLHWLPFWLVTFLWRVSVVAALYVSMRIALRLMKRNDPRAAMLWTAGGIWLEPIVGNIKSGNVGVFLMLVVLYAAYSTRWWASGLLVGVASGVKLTPAIAAFYFGGGRRWAAMTFSVVAFLATLLAAYPLVGNRVVAYFTDWIGGDSLFSMGYTVNQSWRAGIARVVGYDPGMSALVVVAIAATFLVAVGAWWMLRQDAVGALLVIMIFGLLVPPVSWTNHWVWLVPLVMWLRNGTWCQAKGARVLFWVWLIVMVVAVPNALDQLQPVANQISRPGGLAWAALIYPLLTVTTFGWMIATGLRARQRTHSGQRRVVRPVDVGAPAND